MYENGSVISVTGGGPSQKLNVIKIQMSYYA